MHRRLIAGGVLAAFASLATAATVLGGREHVRILGKTSIELTARLNPATADSLLMVEDMKYRLGADGSTWVRFTVAAGEAVTLARVTLEQPVIKDLRLPQRDGGLLHVPTVQLRLCIGDRQLQLPLQLRERHGYTESLILGADALKNLGTVQAGSSFLHEPDCAPATISPVPTVNRSSGG
ncbi:MAG: ATP-dependent zinc protease [Gammaproteobacteria bacterium]|nr:ATP-dependent zinc protease [Gammaproteobacteria bacterium]